MWVDNHEYSKFIKLKFEMNRKEISSLFAITFCNQQLRIVGEIDLGELRFWLIED